MNFLLFVKLQKKIDAWITTGTIDCDTESEQSELETKTDENEPSNKVDNSCHIPIECKAKMQIIEVLIWVMLDKIYQASETFNEYRNAPNDFAVQDLKDELYPQSEMAKISVVFIARCKINV